MQTLDWPCPGRFDEPERPRDRVRDEVGIVNAFESHEPCPVLERAGPAPRELDGEAGLARPARPGQGDQWHLIEQPFEHLELGRAADERRQPGRKVAGHLVAGRQWRELGRKVFDDQLRDGLGTIEVAQAVAAQGSDADAGRQRVGDQRVRGLGQQHLATVAEAGDAGGPVHVEAHVVVTAQPADAGMQTHPDAHIDAGRPLGPGECLLGVRRSRDRSGGLGEHHEEGVALGATLHAAVARKGRPKRRVVPLEDIGEDCRAEVLDEPGRPLHVREQEGHGSRGEHPFGHPRPSIRPTRRRIVARRRLGYHPAVSLLLLVDLDGVVYRGADPVPGVAQVLAARAAAGDDIVYVTNNSMHYRADYVTRLEGMGAPITPDTVVSSARATALFVAEQDPPIRRVLVLGAGGLEREARDVGLDVVTAAHAATRMQQEGIDGHAAAGAPDAVLVGLDPNLTYLRLAAAADCIRAGARFIATNRDPVYPTERGLRPGAGSIVAAVEATTGVVPLSIGKPAPRLLEIAAHAVGRDPRDAVMIGDGILTDLAAANALGARTVFMLTGVSTRDQLRALAPGDRPVAVAANADELAAALDALSATPAAPAPA